MVVFRGLILSVGVLFAAPCFAQTMPPLTNLRVTPNPAQAGQPVSAILRAFCFASVPGSERVTRQGSLVTLTNNVDQLCGVPLPIGHLAFPLGSFAPGKYTLVYAPTSSFDGVTYVTQSTQFVVLPNASAVPATTSQVAALLALLIGSLGVLRLTSQRSDCGS